MDYYSAIKRNEIEPFIETWMNLESVIQSEVSQKEKNKYRVLMHACGIWENGADEPRRRNGDADVDSGLVDTEQAGENGESSINMYMPSGVAA